jgi:hypothetical protein
VRVRVGAPVNSEFALYCPFRPVPVPATAFGVLMVSSGDPALATVDAVAIAAALRSIGDQTPPHGPGVPRAAGPSLFEADLASETRYLERVAEAFASSPVVDRVLNATAHLAPPTIAGFPQ